MFDYQLVIDRSKTIEVHYPANSSEVIELKDVEGNTRAYHYQVNDTLWMHWPGLATFHIDRRSNQVIAIDENHQPEDLIKDLFWRNVLPFVLQAQGWEAIHASAVKTPHGVMAFCAASGTGKSTIAYGFHQRGYPLWSDDSLIFHSTPEDILVYPVRFSLRLLADSRQHFGFTPDSYGNMRKQIILHRPTHDETPQKLSKVFIMERVNAKQDRSCSIVNLCSKTDSFQYLLENAFCFSLYFKNEKKILATHYLDLVKQVPVYKVDLTPNLEDLDWKLDQIESAFTE